MHLTLDKQNILSKAAMSPGSMNRTAPENYFYDTSTWGLGKGPTITFSQGIQR